LLEGGGTVLIEEEILWFDISMDYTTLMKVFKDRDDTGNEESDLFLLELFEFGDMIP
jgi:hypothetical protein